MAKRSADHRWAIDGNAMVHRWPMDGLPWDPNSGIVLKSYPRVFFNIRSAEAFRSLQKLTGTKLYRCLLRVKAYKELLSIFLNLLT